MSKVSAEHYINEEEDDDPDESHIEWSNLIFLPFHPVFKLIVLISVIVKSILGPIQSIYPIVYCSDVMDSSSFLIVIKNFYLYCCDSIYGIDTFLHIVHRQVIDKAMRREHLPKSAFLLLVDIISLIPFFRLMATDMCPSTQLWPNVLAFNEFFIIYRVLEYFSLVTTHSFWEIVTGFTLMLASCISCTNCFWLLLTKQGLCAKCNDAVYDWRNYVMHKLNETDERFSTYVYGTSFVLSFVINRPFDETKPSTILEFNVSCIFMLFGYLLSINVVIPKLFAEAILRLRSVCAFHPHVQRIIQETKSRNSSPKAHVDVEHFYNLMWKKRSGITTIPEIITELPRYLTLDIRQDLVWPVFYHSPSLRKTSTPFQRWLCEYIRLDYKLPGEKFFAGPHWHSNLYYLKSGVVQLISADDGTTPVLSVTSGTIFGDISFLVPPLKRKLTVRCLTYCEVFLVSRLDVLKALHIFPEDCRHIINHAKERMKHARTLYACKQHVRGLDRAEDEGIAWIKRRWWEISDAISNWKKKSIKKEQVKFALPPEEAVYHCAKYIGQLALCTDVQLQTKSMFANVKFPWILVPDSSFGFIWHRIIIITVFLVLILYPPYISRQDSPPWFKFFKFWTDLIYASDICVSLLTSVMKKENVTASFASVMFARCKSLYFLLDVMATLWIEYLTIMIGNPEFFYLAQFNRLIKIYILFTGEYISWEVKKNPMTSVYIKIVLAHFSFVYILGYFVYMIDSYLPDLTTTYFFGIKYCRPHVPKTECDIGGTNVLIVALSWTFELFFPEYLPHKLIDIYFAMAIGYASFMIYTYCETRLIASLYLKYRDVTNYQYFVSNLKKYYQHYKIHHDLLKRLDRYLMCHWKYYHGVDVMHPNMLKDEPYDIYWKVHGEVAEKIISESEAFAGAEPTLIRELACTAKFLILPKNSTLFLFGVQCINVTWIVKGHIKCEYHNEEGELLKVYYDSGYMLSISSVFFGKPSLRTYTSCTECEVLYIRKQDFFKIIKHYPNEWSYFESCIQEFEPVFDKLFHAYVKKHRDYQKKLRDNIFHARMSLVPKVKSAEHTKTQTPFVGDFWEEPESEFMKIWMLFRAVIVFVSIAVASLQGGSGAIWRRQLIIIGAFCDCMAWIDIIIKLFLSYYDKRGILITDKRKCMVHYLSRGFVLDLIGAVPWFEMLSGIMTKSINDNDALLTNTICKFAHLHILLGYFNYIGDVPTVNFTFIKILKLQVLLILIMLGASQFFVSNCVNFEFDGKANLIRMTSRNSCWVPKFFQLAPKPTIDQLHILFAESLNLAQCGFMRTNFGRFHIDRYNLGVGIVLFILGITFWYVMCYSLSLLVLNSRGNTLFQHGVSQLRRFLKAERVDNKLTEHAAAHFRYWWLRTKGINIHHLTNERIGVVFRQDLSYYFFRITFTALDTILLGGESLEHQLASVSTQVYYLPGEEIVREMDLTFWVFIVHRGNVIIIQNGEKLAILTKGGIFGQLSGTSPRPVRISAICDDYADLLQINIKQFQELIGDDVRVNIAQNPQSQNDYMATKKHFYENPYNSIKYILRGRKTIKLPWMKAQVEARHNTWYSRWLYLVWLGGPFTSTTVVLILYTLPPGYIQKLYWVLLFLDVVNFANFIAEFFTIELIVVDNNLVNRVIGWRVMKGWSFYVNALSILIPLLSFITGEWIYQLARLLRLHLFYYFHFHFCRSFKSIVEPVLMKFLILFLLLHAMSCGWIYVACRNSEFPITNIPEITPELNATIDYDQWVIPRDRKGGCARVTRNFDPETRIPSFVVPKQWQNDYIVAMTYIIIIYTHTSIDSVIALTLGQVYYKVVVSVFIYWINMWMMSVTVSAVYTKFRELYQYDYNVSSLTTYLKHSGLSPSLLESVKEYTNQLWRRQRGNWLPELAQQAPLCLREDLLGALYMHHLKTPLLFRQLPPYFTRQLVARFQRIVIFPGKCIVQEGDIFSCIYFIHEGEVEKWLFDKTGEDKMISLLTTNGYFGLIPGLFPSIPFQFTYYSRTVVDLVFLKLKDWQDLLDSYPDVKHDLYAGAKQFKRDSAK